MPPGLFGGRSDQLEAADAASLAAWIAATEVCEDDLQAQVAPAIGAGGVGVVADGGWGAKGGDRLARRHFQGTEQAQSSDGAFFDRDQPLGRWGGGGDDSKLALPIGDEAGLVPRGTAERIVEAVSRGSNRNGVALDLERAGADEGSIECQEPVAVPIRAEDRPLEDPPRCTGCQAYHHLRGPIVGEIGALQDCDLVVGLLFAEERNFALMGV